MSNKTAGGRGQKTDPAGEMEALYQQLVQALYGDENRARALAVAENVEAFLTARPEFADSIRAEEVRSLIAEARGDLAEAIRRRESEIDKIRRLHGLAENKPGWDYVLRQYDYGDLSDRLDILASLYAEQADLDRAVELLHESKQFCESHQVPFDGQDLLDEYEQARRKR